MDIVPVNYLAVVVSAIIMMVLGWLWYGPLFGKYWIALSGWSQADMKARMQKGDVWKSYSLMAVGALIMSFVLEHAIIFAEAYLGMSGLSGGFMVGFMNWIGFVAPVTVGTVLWEDKSWKLWALNAGYYLVGLVIIGALLSVWM